MSNGPEDAEPTAELQACSGTVPGGSRFITYRSQSSRLCAPTCHLRDARSAPLALLLQSLWLLEKTEPPSEESSLSDVTDQSLLVAQNCG